MKRALCGLLLLWTIGCSNTSSPTAPTASQPPAASQPPTASGPTVADLRWTVIASSCAPVTLPPSQPSFADARISQSPDGGLIASWPYQSKTLYARFILENGTWGLCSWDVADV